MVLRNREGWYCDNVAFSNLTLDSLDSFNCFSFSSFSLHFSVKYCFSWFAISTKDNDLDSPICWIIDFYSSFLLCLTDYQFSSSFSWAHFFFFCYWYSLFLSFIILYLSACFFLSSDKLWAASYFFIDFCLSTSSTRSSSSSIDFSRIDFSSNSFFFSQIYSNSFLAPKTLWMALISSGVKWERWFLSILPLFLSFISDYSNWSRDSYWFKSLLLFTILDNFVGSSWPSLIDTLLLEVG